MFNKVLVANRGAVASRVIRALNEMGIASVAVFSEADCEAPYLQQASEAFAIGPAMARESYLDMDKLLDVARRSGADAIHPGYGFLSENSAFAQRVEAEGIHFIGPAPALIDAMGHKTKARDLMSRHGMSIGSGSGVLPNDPAAVTAAAEKIGYPILVKPAGGGGGIGMIAARHAGELIPAIERAASMAQRGFSNADLYLERLVERPRHVEFQVLADHHGTVRHLFERDCSVQRRHQKVIEEAPAPGLSREAANEIGAEICATLARIGYDNIGTVEMLMAPDGGFHFLEMNTRLQVEHGVTEEVTGVDLVKAQIRSSAGERLTDTLNGTLKMSGHAIQARVYAEDPKRFFPSPGPLNVFRPPQGDGVRVETGYAEGGQVTPFYDPMIAKVIVKAPTRVEAAQRLAEVLEDFAIEGVKHNIPALIAVLRSQEFLAGDVHTGLLQGIKLN